MRKEKATTCRVPGQMQPWSLTLDKILVSAAETWASTPVVSRNEAGGIRRSDYAGVRRQAERVSAALLGRGIVPGDRVASLMWNNADHLALWFGAIGIGAVLHTLNPRLHASQLAWIIADAGDRLLIVEERFVPLIAGIADAIPGVELVVVATAGTIDAVGSKVAIPLDDFLAIDPSAVAWGGFDEAAAAGLCYTSGTTGAPKGVLYSHRSTFLHALAANQPNAFGIGAGDVVLPIVPMFHASAWGLPFVAPMAGAALVLPGSRLDGGSLLDLMAEEGVTFAAAVPTVWQDLLQVARRRGLSRLSLRRAMVGGAAVSADIVRGLDALDVELLHGWGMTELSPLGTISTRLPADRDLDPEARVARRVRQGRAVFPLEARIVDPEGRTLPHDDRATGALLVRGPAVVQRYFNAAQDIVGDDGFFDTGDIAAIAADGSMRLVDRSKDVIKSGGE